MEKTLSAWEGRLVNLACGDGHPADYGYELCCSSLCGIIYFAALFRT